MKNNLFSFISLVMVIIVALVMIIFFITSKKIGFVDNHKVLEGYALTSMVRNDIQVKAKDAQDLINNIQQDLDGLRNRFIKESDTLSENEKTELKNEILIKEESYNNNVSAIKNQLPEYEKKMMGAVITDINKKINEYGKKNNFSIVFGATEYGNIVYADKGIDLTGKIIEYLNSVATTNQQVTDKTDEE